MAGNDLNNIFPEKISSFLMKKMETIKQGKGEDSGDYKGLYLQYKKLDLENNCVEEKNERHWQADLNVECENKELRGIERLYNRSLVIEPTMICIAHCRYCLRANYKVFTLREKEIVNIAKYCGSKGVGDHLKEVLITGGDPLVVPQTLKYLIEAMMEFSPNVKIFRIATRLLTQDPTRIDNNVYEIFKNKPRVRFELATQINHPVEFFPEAIEKIEEFNRIGVRIYSQNVLLKGVNDNIDVLASLYDKMRDCNIESHYLFHCVPMKGMQHLRTSVDTGLNLVKALSNSGIISGRAKPMYAAMTDIGKITFYGGTIVEKNERKILLQSNYKYKDRLEWNPNWNTPETAEVDKNGFLRVWYLDGLDD